MTERPTGPGRVGVRHGPLHRAGRAELHRGRAVAASSPEECFVEAYRAARAAAAALLAQGPRRRGPVDVWGRLGREVPELAEWAEVFAGYARLAAAVEDGLPRRIGAGLAQDFLWAVGCFLDLVDRRLGVLGAAPPAREPARGCRGGTASPSLV